MSADRNNLARGLLELDPEAQQLVRKLQESEERFRQIFTYAATAISISDMQGRIVDCNPALCTLLGYTENELKNMNFAPFIHPDDRAANLAAARQLFSGEISLFKTENRYIRKDGQIVWTHKIVSTLPDEQGQPAHLVALVTDITEHRQSEKKLRMLAEVLDEAPGYVGVHDFNGHVLYANRQASLMHGYTREEFAKLNLWDLNPPENASVVAAKLQTLIQHGEAVFEIDQIRRDGTLLPLSVQGKIITWNDSPAVLGIATDISERRRLQKALEQRIVALTRPLDQSADITFDELFDRQQIQRLQDEFAAATGVASIITRPDGTPITEPSHFTDFCFGVVRKTEKGLTNCFKSDAFIGRHCAEGPIVQHCLSSGLWDAGASIEVGGKHLANWLVGQVRDETQTEEQMLRYAREIGADEAVFMEAFRRVPVMRRARFEEIARFLFTLAGQLSTAAYQNFQQARFIAAQKEAEQAMRESEEKYRRLFESTSDALVVFDGETRRILDVNHAAETLYGYTREEFLQHTNSAFTAEPDASDRAIRQALAENTPSQVLISHRKKDGTVFQAYVTACTFLWKGRPVVCGAVRDITEHINREKLILKNRNELSRLAAELSLAGLRERQQIAAGLHDGLSQLLISAHLRLSILEKTPLPDRTHGELGKICEILRQTVQTVREMTFELSCPLLAELGLGAALEELCAELSREHAIRVVYTGDTRALLLPADQQLVLYRSTRELLVNAMKHSNAKKIRVELQQDHQILRICVQDDGSGFDASAAGHGFSSSGGFGLFNLREGLQQIGGRLEIKSAPGEGTQVILTVPMESTI